jgi:AcrR family transcriptional regulator
MGVKERKERQKVEMKDLILQSAHQLFLEKGFGEVSIRNIAEAIEYSPATIYLYFKDKNDIFYALHGEAFKSFNLAIAPITTIKDPLERLFSLGEKYMEFAFSNPKYYDIMFIIESPMQCDENSEDWKEGESALKFLESIVFECIGHGHFKNQDPKILAFSIWSYMHGMCSLALRDRMKVYPEEERASMQLKSFEIFKQMLRQL